MTEEAEAPLAEAAAGWGWYEATGERGDFDCSNVHLTWSMRCALSHVQVLCFSDTRDQYSQETHTEDTAGLTRRLSTLDAQLKALRRAPRVASHAAALAQ